MGRENADAVQPERLLTPAQVAGLWGVNVKSVSRWAKDGKLDEAVQWTLGRTHRRYREPVILRMLAEHRGNGRVQS